MTNMAAMPIYGKNLRKSSSPEPIVGGRVERWCWVNFQCRGRPTIWNKVGQGPTARVGVVWTFLLSSILSFLILPLFGRRPDIDWNTVSKGR